MSFWTAMVQNGVVLNQLSLIQNDIVWVSDNLCKTTLFWTLAALNDVVLSCILKKKKTKLNDVVFCPTEMKRPRFGNEQP